MKALTAAAWQRDRLPVDATPVAKELPPQHEQVLGWVSDEEVAIHHFPLVVWRDGYGKWWGGLPASYLDLDRLRWKVTHWKPIGKGGNE